MVGDYSPVCWLTDCPVWRERGSRGSSVSAADRDYRLKVRHALASGVRPPGMAACSVFDVHLIVAAVDRRLALAFRSASGLDYSGESSRRAGISRPVDGSGFPRDRWDRYWCSPRAGAVWV
jgi:hypothetical protein